MHRGLDAPPLLSGSPRTQGFSMTAISSTHSTTWPSLPLSEWANTKDTLHLWTQVVGKVRLALAPRVNHWWHVPLYVTARGLTPSAMPYRDMSIELSFD